MDDILIALMDLAKTQGIPMVVLGLMIWRQQGFIESQGNKIGGFVEAIAEISHTLADIRSSLTTALHWQNVHDAIHERKMDNRKDEGQV